MISSVSPHQNHTGHVCPGIIPEHMMTALYNHHVSQGNLADAERVRNHLDSHRVLRALRPTHQGVLPDGEVVKVYDAGHRDTLPGVFEGDDTASPQDPAGKKALENTEKVHTFWLTVFGRHSIDGRGMPFTSTVHYEEKYDNAFFNGEQMVYGDGDGTVFGSFVEPLDVTGHEIGHGVTQFTAGLSLKGIATGLDYEKQAGGLNEGWSDIQGMMIRDWAAGTSATESNWLIGEGLILPVSGRTFALRNMLHPGTGYVNHPVLGTDKQVGTLPDYLALEAKEAVDPHIGSGIPNRAFATAAVKLGGNSWESLGQIYMHALRSLGPQATFLDAAHATIGSAITLKGAGSAEESAVREGWKVTQVML